MVRIRPATEADYEAVLRVQQEAFGEYANVYHHLDLICFAKYREPVASRLR
jgi:predicted N-acetyltransferase YhbS